MRLVSATIRAGTTLSAGLFLVFVFVAQGVFFIRANAPTYDEAQHLAAGYSYLATRDFRLEPQNPPLIKELVALPLFLLHRLPFDPDPRRWRDGDDFYIGQDFLYQSALRADQMLLLSRVVNLFLGTLLVALVGWWAYRLWGNYAGLLASALACFEPNLVAHSCSSRLIPGPLCSSFSPSIFFGNISGSLDGGYCPPRVLPQAWPWSQNFRRFFSSQ